MIKEKKSRRIFYLLLSSLIIVASEVLAMFQPDEEEQLKKTSHAVVQQAMKKFNEARQLIYTPGCISASYNDIKPYMDFAPIKELVSSLVKTKVEAELQKSSKKIEEKISSKLEFLSISSPPISLKIPIEEQIEKEVEELRRKHQTQKAFLESIEFLRDYYTFSSGNEMYEEYDPKRAEEAKKLYIFINKIIEKERTNK